MSEHAQPFSKLGFGTSALMSRVNRRDSLRLLETCIDAGITHFDTARSYGFGEAESVVGEALRGRRDRLTVTTKVGILPPRRVVGLGAAKSLARSVISAWPAMRSVVRRGAGTLVQPGCFDEVAMAASVEASLRTLGTEYVDVLLLHEPPANVLRREEPLRFLQRMQEQGKARRYGVAATAEVAGAISGTAWKYAPVLEVPHSAYAPLLPEVEPPQDGWTFLFSAMGNWLGELKKHLQSDAALHARWSEEMGVDVCSQGTLEGLALQFCLAARARSTVLFTSTREDHIRENAAVLKTAALPEMVNRFAELVQEWKRLREA